MKDSMLTSINTEISTNKQGLDSSGTVCLRPQISRQFVGPTEAKSRATTTSSSTSEALMYHK